MAFRVGQKVVCVDDGDMGQNGHWERGTAPIVGNVYTIRELGTTTCGRAGMRLHELRLNGERGAITGKPFKDSFYLAVRFRPVVERKTDLSIFTAMLTPKKTRVKA